MKVTLSPQAAEDLDTLPLVVHVRVLKILERLEDWPRVSGAKPLTGRLAGHFRVRTGDYRLQFRLEGARLVVEKIGHRSRFHED